MAAVNAAEMSDPFSNANSLFIGDGFMSLMTIAALSEYSQQKLLLLVIMKIDFRWQKT